MTTLINAEYLARLVNKRNSPIVLDATYMPDDDNVGYELFKQKHIPTARFFDLNAFSNKDVKLAHTALTDSATFGAKLAALGINKDSELVFYDQSPLHSACKALWLMKLYGHDPEKLFILDGGFAAWQDSSNQYEEGDFCQPDKPSSYPVNIKASMIKTMTDVKHNIENGFWQILDGRHALDFAGLKRDQSSRAGHIPGSFCLPHTCLFNDKGFWLQPEQLMAIIEGTLINHTMRFAVDIGKGLYAREIKSYL